MYVYVEAAQPELGMLIIDDVDAALAALHQGRSQELFGFRRTIANEPNGHRLFTRSAPEQSRAQIQIRIETVRSALRNLAAASGALVTVQHRRFRQRRK